MAIVDDKAVGYAQFFQKNYDRVHLNEIAVAETSQNQGIGTLLIEAVEESTRERGAKVVELFCSNCNTKAVDFYNGHRYITERSLLTKTV